MQDGLLIGFHVISCVQFAFSVYYDYTYIIIPPNVLKVHNGYGGKFKFLTFWDAVSMMQPAGLLFYNQIIIHAINLA